MSSFVIGIVAAAVLVTVTIFVYSGVQVSSVAANDTKATHVHL